MTTLSTATIRLVRETAPWRDRARSYRVIIDNQVAGRIGWGQTQIFQVEAGEHGVWLRIDWCGSKPVRATVESGEVLELRCKSNGSPWGIWTLVAQIMWRIREYLALWRSDEAASIAVPEDGP